MGKTYCISIGLNYKYPGSMNELPDCDLDAKNTYHAVKPDSGQVFLEMSAQGIMDDRLYPQLTKKDTLVVSYSGHGTLLPDGRGALCLWSATTKMQYLPTDVFIDYLAKKPCKVILILDCCFAAAGLYRDGKSKAVRSIPFEVGVEIVGGINRFDLSDVRMVLNPNKQMWALAACSKKQTAASTGIGGEFTLGLLKSVGYVVSQNKLAIRKSKTVGVRSAFLVAKKVVKGQDPEMEGSLTSVTLFKV